MTRLSELLLPTERDAPADAEAISHKLMVRAGLIRQLGAGLWTWMPAGWRVHQRIVEIVREEMDAIGGQEMLMPLINPRELWHRTGRGDLDELFKLEDRKGTEMVLAMTHEEAVTQHVAQIARSYRDLPLFLYHFQLKARDEPRPRAGVLRTREFTMKDAYSFDLDVAGLNATYEACRAAYARIFERCGLEFFESEADVGMMGGSGAHEYMAPCTAGENDVALAPGYAANVEVATADPQPVAPLTLTGKLDTPGQTTIDAVASALHVEHGNLLKAFPVVTDSDELVLVFLRGDHTVEETKLRSALQSGFRPANEQELDAAGLVPGFIGPRANIRTLLDAGAGDGPWITGANATDTHVVIDTLDAPRADIRTVVAGDTINGTPIEVVPAIEIGNIFKLGTRYSEPLGAKVLDDEGNERTLVMGSYGLGPARVAAAAVEQYADDSGIAWPKNIAPYDIEIVPLGKPGGDEQAKAAELYGLLKDAGFTVLLDDRDAGPGEKFADAELLGAPLRLTVGKRSLESGAIEAQARRGKQDLDPVPLDDFVQQVRDRWNALP
ncbi:MAG TPA: proline--tRNA ligase [Baekduia sp.]|nr:proline--tRNA ligase [Baekduia sp.]